MKPRFIINFPTKAHWRGKSKLEYIETGLDDLVAQVCRLGIASLAVPPLGCGLGGLRWEEVFPEISAAFAPLPEVRLVVFAPADAARDQADALGEPERPSPPCFENP